ncbi:MAG TPA: ABC transporter substrate-binding protein [Methylomirabilota bacterium]|nr:ABC transporter substrate-binding protein [Methylomirabilota bacterium]
MEELLLHDFARIGMKDGDLLLPREAVLMASVIDRRAFIGTLAGGLLAAPLAAQAQPVGTIAFLCADSCVNIPHAVTRADRPFLRGLEGGGYTLGLNASVDTLGVGVGYRRLREMADRLVKRKAHVIVVVGNTEARAARQATRTTPIVMVNVVDPVEEGLVASLGRPGGNLTGLAVPFDQLAIKQIEVLKEIQPRLGRLAVFWSPLTGLHKQRLGRLEAAARSLGVTTYPVEITTFRDLDKTFASLPGQTDGLLVLEPLTMGMTRREMSMLALRHRLPSVASDHQWVDAGGLMAYGPNLEDQYERAGAYVAKLLRGASPRDLPVEEPTRFELIISKTTAKALGLTIPPSLLQRADQVIE